MFKRKHILILVFLGFFLFRLVKYHYTTDVSRDVEYVIMSQSWAPTICLLWLRDSDNNTCSTDGLGTWIMHGIWLPGQVLGESIHCNDSWSLDTEQIRDIEPQLNRHWTNVNDTSGYTFWSHEWIKHGTCFALIKHFNSQKKYFMQGLKWMKEYSLTDVLDEGGIMPSNDAGYNVEDLFKVILSKFKVTLEVICVKVEGKQLLREVHICFDIKNLQLADCWDDMNYLKSWQYGEGMSVNTNCDLGTETLYISKADKRTELVL